MIWYDNFFQSLKSHLYFYNEMNTTVFRKKFTIYTQKEMPVRIHFKYRRLLTGPKRGLLSPHFFFCFPSILSEFLIYSRYFSKYFLKGGWPSPKSPPPFTFWVHLCISSTIEWLITIFVKKKTEKKKTLDANEAVCDSK